MVAATSKGFKFDPGGIGAILKGHRLTVPPYQREYSWEKEQVEQLFADLYRAKSEHSDHFLGTIVTIDAGEREPLQIVDGQQRLTTTSLLIAAIRDFQRDMGQPEREIESINTDYLTKYERQERADALRLILNIDDREFFAGIVTGKPLKPTRESHQRIQVAFDRARAFVRQITGGFAEKDKVDALNEWLSFIEHEASVILVRTDNASRAFKMFETLNDRGLKTSQADLVKSYLFGESGDRIMEAQARWSSMKDNLEEVADDDRAINFLRHVMIATQRFVRAEEIFEAVQKAFRGKANSIGFLTNLETFSRTYIATFQPSAEQWMGYPPSTPKALTVFNQFDLKPMRPLMLALALQFKPKEFDRAAVLLVSLSVRLVIASRTRSGTIESTFGAAALAVYKEEITTAAELAASLKNVIVPDVEFVEEFTKARVSKAELARYYLRTLESANAKESEPWYIPNPDASEMTLEHVLPQNPGAGWGKFDADAVNSYRRRLGNLCLMNKSGNEKLGDRPFVEKREKLADAPYEMTRMIGKLDDWTPANIEDRQRALAHIAVKAWPI